MRGRVGLVVVACMVTLSACGGLRGAASSADDVVAASADDIARVVGSSKGDVLAFARSEAGATGLSTDEVVVGWRGRALSVGDDLAIRYRGLPPEVRIKACSAVTTTLLDTLDGDPRTDSTVLSNAIDEIAATPHQEAVGLAEDLGRAVADLAEGNPVTLELLLLKRATCEAAGS